MTAAVLKLVQQQQLLVVAAVIHQRRSAIGVNSVTLRHTITVLADEADSDWNEEDLSEYRTIVQYSISGSRAANS